MGIYESLIQKKDVRKGGTDCSFNGFLEDYLELIEDQSKKELFASLLEENNDLRIITDLMADISANSVSNAVIRYKDIVKLSPGAIRVPFIFYGSKDEQQKAMIVTDSDFIFAKGIYFALTENGADLESGRNDIIAACMEDDLKSVCGRFYKDKAGYIQRDLDRKHFSGYDEAFERVLELSSRVIPEATASFKAGEDGRDIVARSVSSWFLLKKFAYVSYMIDRSILKNVHNDNVRMQRNRAKDNADKVRFISISELWRLKEVKNEEGVEE